jgi:hypothetical protein
MKQQDFEARVLSLWTKTRIPLTRPNLLVLTKASRSELDRRLDEMVKASLLELDSDDEGELLWVVPGSSRPTFGPDTVAELERKERLQDDVDKLTSGAKLALRAAGFQKPAATERKSLVASGALSLFFGPVGWLYAAPLKEAIPAIIVYVLLFSILSYLPLIGTPIMGVLAVASALAGIAYAWSYNQEGRRVPLLGKAKAALPPMRSR